MNFSHSDSEVIQLLGCDELYLGHDGDDVFELSLIGPVAGVVAVDVSDVEICSVVDELNHGLVLAEFAGIVQRSEAVFGLDVNVCSIFQKVFYYLLIIKLHSLVQSSAISHVIYLLDIHTSLQFKQQKHDLHRLIAYCENQRARIIHIQCINLSFLAMNQMQNTLLISMVHRMK